MNNNTVTMELPNKSKVSIDVVNSIMATEADLKKATIEHGVEVTSSNQLQGSAGVVGVDGFIQLAKDSEEGTIDHEVMELAMKLTLKPQEKAAIEKKYGSKEQACNAYRDWQKQKKQGKGSAFGKLWQKIQDFADRVKAFFGNAKAKLNVEARNVFENVASGEVWERDNENRAEKGDNVNSFNIRESAEEKLKADEAAWSKTVDDLSAARKSQNEMTTTPIKVMETPLSLQLIGAKTLPIYMEGGKYYQIQKDHPSMTDDVLKQLPRALTDPMIIFESSTKPGRVVVGLSLTNANGNNVIVPFALDVTSHSINMNLLVSAYAKDELKDNQYINRLKWFAKNIEDNKTLYVNVKKTTDLFMTAGVQFPIAMKKISGFSNSNIPTEADLVKLKNENPTSYSVRPSADDISYSVRSATENLAKNLKNMGKDKKNDRIVVEKRVQRQSDKFGMINNIVSSPSYISEKYPQFKAFFKMADKAMQTQEAMRGKSDKVLNRIYGLLKDNDSKEQWQSLLWEGDLNSKEFTRSELQERGVPKNVIKAYLDTRQAIRNTYNLLNETRKQVRTYQKNVDKAKLEELKQSKFIEILKTESNDEDYIVTYKAPKIWTKHVVVDSETYDALSQTQNVQIMDKNIIDANNIDVTYQETIGDLHSLTGYIPHYFHDFFIATKDASGEHVIIGSARTVKEATKIAEKYISENPDSEDKVIISPKGFSLDGDEGLNAAVVGDKEFSTIVGQVQDEMEMSVAEAKEFLKGKVKTHSRHRFFGNFMQRKGASGFDNNLDWVLKHYFNAAARYIALEEFKPTSISLFERYYGAFDKDYSNNPLAHSIKQYINDINGNPSNIETMVNNFLNGLGWWNKYIASNFGDRAALQLASSITGKISLLKLGFMSPSSALLNISQIVNVVGVVGDFKPVFAAIKEALHPTLATRKVYAKTGILNDITLASANGYSKFKPGNLARKSMYLFRTMDMFVRKVAVLAGYYSAKTQGKTEGEAIQNAKEVNRKANFDYSVADAPNIFRRGSIFSQIALQFKKYSIKELELMGDLTFDGKGMTAKKAKFWGTYLLMCGLLGIPALDWFDNIWQTLFGPSPKKKIQKLIFEAAGDNPVGRELAKISVYGLLAASPVNVDISSRAGMGDFSLSAQNGLDGMIGGPAYSTAKQFAQAIGRCDTLAGVKALSPALGNYMQAAMGETQGYRGRTTSKLDEMYDRVLKASGFRNVNDSIQRDVKGIAAAENNELRSTQKSLVDKMLAKQAAGETLTKDDVQALKEAGVTGKMLQNERKKKSQTDRERMLDTMSRKQKQRNEDLLKFIK